MTKEFDFNLLDTVNITELQRPGIILEINIDTTGIQYRVRYFDDGDAKYVYFFSNELKLKRKSII